MSFCILNKGHIMLAILIKFFDRYFSSASYSNELDRFVLSKKPTSVIEMEYWVKEYDRKMTRGQGWIL